MRPVLDVVDAVHVVAAAEDLAPLLCDERAWARWFPDLRLHCYADRGPLGKRWTVGGPLDGTCEVWLEQRRGGTVVHLFWQADPAGGPPRPRARRRARRRLERRYAERLRAEVLAVKDGFDADRPAGELRVFETARDRVTTTRAEPSPGSVRARRTRARTEEVDDGDGRADHE